MAGTTIGDVTDGNGRFSIGELEHRSYTLIISSIGFERTERTVEVQSGRTTDFTIGLNMSVDELDEVVVFSKTETREKMEQPIKVEAINLEAIRERSTPVAQLINQMPGVNIRQTAGVGSTVIVNLNGLQGNAIRYFRDGIPLNYLGKAFDLSIVPIGQLGGLEVYKGVLPAELGADALGGAINFNSANIDENQLDVSYGFGSFNTHSANVNAYYQIPGTKLFTRLTSYYVHSDNNYKMEVNVVDKETQTLIPATVERFHDGVDSKFIEVAGGVKETKWADFFEVGYAHFDYEKENQHGFTISTPFGEVTSFENFHVVHTRYKKKYGNLELDLFGAFSDKRTVLIDSTRNRYNWFGDVISQGSYTSGEARSKSFLNLDFQNIAGRFNISYRIGGTLINANHTATTRRRIGSDIFGNSVTLNGEEVDPFSFPATYNKNVTGLQVSIPYWNERITHVITAKRYSIITESLNPQQFIEDSPKFSKQNYGYGSSLKFAFTQDRFFRLSYENTFRIPESIEYFGDGNFLLGNNNLLPEQSHNINFGFYSPLDRKKNWFLDINTFYRHVNNQILLVPIWVIFSQYQNLDDALVKGIEASIKTNLFDHLKIDANVTWQDARRVNLSIAGGNNLKGSRLPFQPYFFTNLNLNYDFSHLLSNAARLSFYTNYGFVEKYIFIPIPKNQEPSLFGKVENSRLNNLEDFLIPTQHLVNLGASYKVSGLLLWLNLEVNNILNLELFDNFRVPKPPLNYQLKIRYQLK